MNRNRVFSVILRYSVSVVVILLVVEFLLGMWVALYAGLPLGAKLTLSQQPDFSGKLEVGIHLIVGVLLGILSVVSLICAGLLKKLVPSVLAALGTAAIIVVGFSGLAFANGGYSDNGESFAMAVAFLVAILVYVSLGTRVIKPPKPLGATSPNPEPTSKNN